MKIFLNTLFILISLASYSQHKYVLKVKGGIDTALITTITSGLNLQDITNSGNYTTQKIKVSSVNLSDVPTYGNQDTAIKYGLVKGDIYKLPSDGNNNRLLAIVDNPIDTNFNLIVDNSNNDAYLKFKVGGSANFGMTVTWGDSSVTENFTGSTTYIPAHRYSTPGIYHVSFTFSDYSLITVVNIGLDFSYYCNVSAFHNMNLFTHINEIDVEGTKMKIWSYYDGLAPTSKSVWFSSNWLSPEELDKLLIYIDGLTFNAGNKGLYIDSQANNSKPTADGLSAITSLQKKGWVVSY